MTEAGWARHGGKEKRNECMREKEGTAVQQARIAPDEPCEFRACFPDSDTSFFGKFQHHCKFKI